MLNPGQSSLTTPVLWLSAWVRLPRLAVITLLAGSIQAGEISIPNASFESPATFFVSLNIDNWQRTPQPGWWDTNTSGDWSTLIGIFKNPAPGNFDHIDNCHSNQAAWLFAQPEVGLFQDYDAMDWNDPAPTHAFDARFEVGKSYRLSVGLLVGGKGSGGGVTPGSTVNFSLYFRDGGSNRVIVAVTTITNSLEIFTNSTHLLEYSVEVPTVRPGDAWAGQHLGILLLSTAELSDEGYWDLDNIRLNSVLAPVFSNPIHTNGQFQFTLKSEPGMALEILTSTNAGLPAAQWTRLFALTNSTGTIPLVDTHADFDQRFYQARQLP
jgi:hypothetical protein